MSVLRLKCNISVKGFFKEIYPEGDVTFQMDSGITIYLTLQRIVILRNAYRIKQ